MAFKEDLSFGEIGENEAILRLYNHSSTKYVVDVRKDEWFQKIDVDFLQVTMKGKVNKIEVKTDRKASETGNLVFETKSNSNKGCLARSRADYVWYFIYDKKEMYIVNMELLRKHIQSNHYKEVEMGDNARGYLIPISALLKEKISIRL